MAKKKSKDIEVAVAEVVDHLRITGGFAPALRSVVVRKVAAIEGLCAEFGIPLAAAALQFPLAHAAVASVIPGIGNVRRIQQTLDLFATEIPGEFWKALSERELIRGDAPTPAGNTGE